MFYTSSIGENFTLKMFITNWQSKKSMMIRENFTLEKLGKPNSGKISPPK